MTDCNLCRCSEHIQQLEDKVRELEALLGKAREALKGMCRSFPTDTDMTEAGWDATEIETACTVYDAARLSLDEITAALGKEKQS